MEAATPLRAIGDRQRSATLLQGKTVSEAVDLFAALGMSNYKPKSRRSFLSRFTHVRDVIGGKLLSDLTELDSDALMIHVEGLNISKERKAAIRIGWFSLIRWLLPRHGIPEDLRPFWPAIKVRPSDWVRSHADFSKEEIARLTAHLDQDMGLYVWFSCFTGQRKSNVLTCEWGEIGTDHVWTIPAAKTKQGREFKIPIHPQLWAMLPPRGLPTDRVLKAMPGDTMIRNILHAAGEKAGLNPHDAIPHNFRRTACRWLAEGGATRDQVQDLFAWSSRDTMLNHYWRTDARVAEKVHTMSLMS